MKQEVKYTEQDYHKNYYSGLSGKLMRQNHIILEKFNFGSTDKILEIGGGFHPHIDFHILPIFFYFYRSYQWSSSAAPRDLALAESCGLLGALYAQNSFFP